MRDNDSGKGAVEQDRPDQKTNVAPLEAQLDHRDQDVLNKMNDTDFPGRGETPEHSGQIVSRNQYDADTNAGDECNQGNRRDPDGNAEGELQDMDPGQRQKENQGDKKDDDLAA